MEHSEISIHEVRICAALRTATGWLTNKELAQLASVSDRTARAHTLKLVDLGVLDQAKVFPGHRYKWSEKAEKRNAAYLNRIQNAAMIFKIAM